MIWIFISALLVHVTSAEAAISPPAEVIDRDYRVLRPGCGVVFSLRSQILLQGHHVHDLLLVTGIPMMSEDHPLALDPLGPFNLSRARRAEEHDLQALYTKLQDLYAVLNEEVSHLKETMGHLLANPVDSQQAIRTPRYSLFKPLGQLSRFLFGTATVDDISKLNRNIHQLGGLITDKFTAFAKFRNISAHFVNATNAKINIFEKAITANTQSLKQLQTGLAGWRRWALNFKSTTTTQIRQTGLLSRYLSYMIGKAANNILFLQEWRAIQQDFLNGLEQLRNGKLSHLLISPGTIKRALQDIKDLLATNNLPYSVVYSDVGFYYDSLITSYSYTRTHVYIHISVPVANIPAQYALYDISVMPVPLQTNGNSSGTGYTVIQNMPHVLALNERDGCFMELSETQLAKCSGRHTLTCNEVFPRRLLDSQSCASALLFNDIHMITSLCSFNIFPQRSVPTQFLQVNTSSFLVSTEHKSYQLSCMDQSVRTVSGCSFCVLRVPCRCTLHVGPYALAASSSACNDSKPLVVKEHTINYAVLAHFGLPKLHFTPTSLSKVPVVLSLPNISIHTTLNFAETQMEKANGIDLAKFAKQFDNVAIPTKPSLNGLGRVGSSSIFGDFHISTSFLSLSSILIMFNTVVNIYLLCKVHSMGLMVYGAHAAAAGVAHLASPNPLLVVSHPPTTTSTPAHADITCNAQNNLHDVLMFAAIVGCIVAVLQICYTCVKICHSLPCIADKYRRITGPEQLLGNVKLYLKIWSPIGGVKLYLMSLPHEPNVLTFTVAPKVQMVTPRQSLIFSAINIYWDGPLQIQCNGFNTQLHLPTHIPVPLALRRTAYKISTFPKRDHIDFILIVHYHDRPHGFEVPIRSPYKSHAGNQSPAQHPTPPPHPHVVPNVASPSIRQLSTPAAADDETSDITPLQQSLTDYMPPSWSPRYSPC